MTISPASLNADRKHDGSEGFTLIQLSIILTIASLLMVSMLPGREAGDVNQKGVDDVAKLAKVEDAMKGFMALNGRRPCPADGQFGVDDHNFGIEAANPGTCIGGTPAAPLGPDAATGNVVAGVVPTKSLNIPDDLAFDSFGRRFTYAVDARATKVSSCSSLQGRNNLGTGAIQINDGTGAVADNTMVAYIGHGPDGHGAWPIQGGLVGGRLNSGSSDPDTLNNANVDGNFNVSFDNVFVKKDRTPTFDDLVYYEQPPKNNCCIGPVCIPRGFRMDGDGHLASWGEVGAAVAIADVNVDGYPDLIITAPGTWGAYDGWNCGSSWWDCGSVYVVFGRPDGTYPDPLPLASLNSSDGYRIDNDDEGPGVGMGNAVTVGDINGDKVSDIIIASQSASPNGVFNGGSYWILFGQKKGGTWPTPMPAAVKLSTLNGSNGFRLDGTRQYYGCSGCPQNQWGTLPIRWRRVI